MATAIYHMRAWNTVLVQVVHWSVEDAPDDTGAQSPYNPGDLQDIITAAVLPDFSSTVEGLLPYGFLLEDEAPVVDPVPVRAAVAFADFEFVSGNLPWDTITPDP